MREQPPSDAYHSLENPSHSDYEEVNNNSSKAKVSTKPKVVPLQSPYSHCGENEIEHSEETEFVNSKVYAWSNLVVRHTCNSCCMFTTPMHVII